MKKRRKTMKKKGNELQRREERTVDGGVKTEGVEKKKEKISSRFRRPEIYLAPALLPFTSSDRCRKTQSAFLRGIIKSARGGRNCGEGEEPSRELQKGRHDAPRRASSAERARKICSTFDPWTLPLFATLSSPRPPISLTRCTVQRDCCTLLHRCNKLQTPPVSWNALNVHATRGDRCPLFAVQRS